MIKLYDSYDVSIIYKGKSYRKSFINNRIHYIDYPEFIVRIITLIQLIIMIKKTSSGYKVTSEGGKNLSKPNLSKAGAEKRLREVEYFKHKK